MKKIVLFGLLLISTLGFSQEKKVYRVYLKDNTTLDIVNPVKVLNNVNYTTLEGNSGTIENNKYYTIRAVGGLLYLIGFFMFAYNIYKTIKCGRVLDKEPINATPVAA